MKFSVSGRRRAIHVFQRTIQYYMAKILIIAITYKTKWYSKFCTGNMYGKKRKVRDHVRCIQGQALYHAAVSVCLSFISGPTV